MSHPKRAESVHVEQLGDELCIYEWQRKEVHALNPTAARVWQLCDGQTSPQQMAATLVTELNIPFAEELVWLTISKLQKAHLLVEEVVRPTRRKLLPRRELLRLGITAALLPAVHSILAPTPVEAQSPVLTTTRTPMVATSPPSASPTDTPTAISGPSASPTDTPTAVSGPSASPTDTPTATATSTPGPTATPTSTLSAYPTNW